MYRFYRFYNLDNNSHRCIYTKFQIFLVTSVFVEMEESSHIKYFIHTMQLACKSATETHNILTDAHGDIISLRRVQSLMKEYKDGDRTDYGDGRFYSGRRMSGVRAEMIETVKEILTEDPRISTIRLAENLEISKSMVLRILKEDLDLVSNSCRFVPHKLSEGNKIERVREAKEIQKALRTRRIDDRLIVTDEKWVYDRPLGCAATRRVWVSPDGDVPQIPRRTISDKKHLVCVAVTLSGKFYIEVLENHESMDSDRYILFLKNMFAHFRGLYPSFIISDFILMHDNARPHISKKTKEYVDNNHIVLLKQPPYSPDFNLLDRLVFPAFEMKRHSCYLADHQRVYDAFSNFLIVFSRNGFINAKKNLVQTLEKVVEAGGSYL